MEVWTSRGYFKYIGSCVSIDGDLQEGVKLRVGFGLKNIDAIKRSCCARIVSCFVCRGRGMKEWL